jgi:hypothetical protein
LEFAVRNTDKFGRLADAGFEASRSGSLTETRIATLRFTEGFVNAFKSRDATPGHSWNRHDGDGVSTVENCPIRGVFAPEEGGVEGGRPGRLRHPFAGRVLQCSSRH